MTASAAQPHPAPAGHEGPLGLLLLLPLGCLVLGQIVLALTGMIPVLDGGLGDPDGYTRLVRVEELRGGQAWFDPTLVRVNPPEGHLQHWTRVVDLLLLIGALVLEPLLGFRDALHLWGVLFSPVCLALTVVALNWATTPLLTRDGRFLACLGLLLQPSVLAYSSLGRPDHHSLLLVPFVLVLGLLTRLLLERQRATERAAGAGVALGLATWISTETLLVVAICHGTLGLLWLGGERRLARAGFTLAIWATATVALALLVERGPQALSVVENDRLSVVHVVLFGLMAALWGGLEWGGRQARNDRIGRRVLLAAAGGALAASALLMVFPDLRDGMLGEVDPLYRELRLERIVEIQPLIWPERLAAGHYGEIAHHVVLMMGIALPALAWLALRVRNPATRRAWLPLAIALSVFLPLAFYQVRWSIYTQTLLVVPYAALIAHLLALATRRLPAQAAVARPAIVVGALFWPMLAAQALPAAEAEIAGTSCPLGPLAGALNRQGEVPRTIMALADYGSELLWRTPHNVLAIANHRPQPGFAATHEALTAADEATARRLIARHRVDWILLCPSGVERDFFRAAGPGGPTLHSRLLAAEPPPWLEPIELPGDALLFAVVPERLAPAGAGANH